MIQKGILVRLTGHNAEETARYMIGRLVGMGRAAEFIDDDMVKRLGNRKSAAVACELLARNGVILVSTMPRLQPECACLDIEINPNDTPDFAAEKVLDQLAESAVITLEAPGYSAEEEERVRQRLVSLGYIE